MVDRDHMTIDLFDPEEFMIVTWKVSNIFKRIGIISRVSVCYIILRLFDQTPFDTCNH
jgi:hypothetical protein